MFRNSGKKITVVAKVLFWLNLVLILGVAGLAVVYVYSSFGTEMALMAALAAAAVVICYMLTVYFSLLVLHGFGELTQSNVEIRRILSENRRPQERPAYAPPAPVRVQSEPERVAPAPVRVQSEPERVAPAPYRAPSAPQPQEFAGRRDTDFQVPGQPVTPLPTPAPAPKPQEPAPKPQEPAPTPAAAPFGMVYCTRCGAKHEPGVAKCRYCGTPLY